MEVGQALEETENDDKVRTVLKKAFITKTKGEWFDLLMKADARR